MSTKPVAQPSSPAKTAAPAPAEGGWLSGNMAQIMVFLNGMILTVTAFATLNVFITQIVDDSLLKQKVSVREYIQSRLNDAEQDFQTGKALLSLRGGQDATVQIEAVYETKPEFKIIYLLRQQSEGQYSAHKLLERHAANEGASNVTDLHKQVIKTMAGEPDRSLFLFTDAKSSNLVFSSWLAQDGDTGRDIVYAVVDRARVLTPEYFGREPNILKLQISTNGGEKSLFSYSNGAAPDTKARPVYQTDAFQIRGLDIFMSLQTTLTKREGFLKKVPFLMLLFGVTLTLIGTLYVRNNYKQAQRLSLMNKELSRRNTDLNHEIVERERLNQALRKAEQENRSIIDSVTDIIFETSTDGRILFLNNTWEKITGFETERSLGRNIFDLLYMQDQAEQKNNFAQLVKGKRQSYRAFTRLRTADGTFRAVELAVSMLRKDDDNGLKIVGTITDVEERRRAERALSEAEKKYRAMVENAASGIYQVTPEGHFLSANASMARILGYEDSDTLMREVHNAHIDLYGNPQERERHMRDAARAEDFVLHEVQMRRKDGRMVWIQENLRGVKDDSNQLIYFEGSIEDITQRKSTELALREAKVQSDLASRAKSEFLANMSHELRTPLNAIIGFSDIIHTQAFGPVGSTEYLEYARDINESGKRLLNVINDILDVSRVEAGDRPLNEGVVDLSRVVHASLDLMASKIEANGMIVSNLIDDKTPRLIGEAHAIKQIINNLLSNAIKFTPAGGRLTLSSELDSYGQLRVSITDTGIGLTDEEIEKALSPFGQVNTGFDKAESGTGLGLTLVQSLMSLHGGAFELFSQKGVGTTATLIFPPKRVSGKPDTASVSA